MWLAQLLVDGERIVAKVREWLGLSGDVGTDTRRGSGFHEEGHYKNVTFFDKVDLLRSLRLSNLAEVILLFNEL